jgi:hypothetical protein
MYGWELEISFYFHDGCNGFFFFWQTMVAMVLSNKDGGNPMGRLLIWLGAWLIWSGTGRLTLFSPSYQCDVRMYFTFGCLLEGAMLCFVNQNYFFAVLSFLGCALQNYKNILCSWLKSQTPLKISYQILFL